jgi:hypothetical protein
LSEFFNAVKKMLDDASLYMDLLKSEARLRPVIRRAMNEYRKIFKEYSDYIGYGYVVGRKPLYCCMNWFTC